MRRTANRPLLLLDIDGVISLWGFEAGGRPPGCFCSVDGIAHFLSGSAAGHLTRLATSFELAWCSGWEEKANEHLPHLLGLGEGLRALPTLRFAAGPAAADAPRHWKLGAIDAHAGPQRPLAWVDDAHDGSCRQWAARRPGPTLLVTTHPAVGLTDGHVAELQRWARDVAAPRRPVT